MKKYEIVEKEIQEFIKSSSKEDINKIVNNFENYILSLDLVNLEIFYESFDKLTNKDFSNKIEQRIAELKQI